jgi:hypothetical protein
MSQAQQQGGGQHGQQPQRRYQGGPDSEGQDGSDQTELAAQPNGHATDGEGDGPPERGEPN